MIWTPAPKRLIGADGRPLRQRQRGFIMNPFAFGAAAASDPYWSNVVLALHMNGANGSTTFTDEKGKTVSAVGTAKISTTQSKFGGSAGYFDASGARLRTPATSEFAFGTGDFTIDAWVYRTAAGGDQYLCGTATTNDGQSGVWWISVGVSAVTFGGYAVGGSLSTSSGVAASTWAFIEVSRVAGGMKIFVNGTLLGSGTRSASLDVGTHFTIGAASADNFGNPFVGYIDDFRVTKGIGRHTSAYTAPTAAFGHA